MPNFTVDIDCRITIEADTAEDAARIIGRRLDRGEVAWTDLDWVDVGDVEPAE